MARAARHESQGARGLVQEAMDYDVVSRTLQSNFWTWLYVTFGGKAWVHWILMLGDLPSELIELANEHIR